MMIQLKQKLSNLIQQIIIDQFSYETDVIVEVPKEPSLGDLSVPLFKISHKVNKTLPELYEILRREMIITELNEYIDDIKFIKGFLNIHLIKEMVIKDVLNDVENDFIAHKKNQTIVIDCSSPNIAKPFSIGHLRSTIIGNAIGNIYKQLGYKVIKVNHLGDWGTQFGKLIVAYQKWGNKELLEKDPINELLKLYIKFHDEMEMNDSLEQEGRQAFLKLEQGEQEYIDLWKWFKEESLKEFMFMYDLLGVSFDSFHGEAFYNDKMDKVVEELNEKNLLEYDDGAYIVKLDDNLAPALIKKSDGSSLYITRDLAAIFYRHQTYQFDEALYVVGNEQSLHFKQLQEVVKKMGYKFNQDIKHINFGLVMQDGKKMSTRKGKIVKLYDVIKEAIKLAKSHIETKNPHLKEIDEVAKAIGVSAVIFNDLKNDRIKDIDFNLQQMLKFEGMTGPYLQYTSVRINSILTKNSFDATLIDVRYLLDYFELIKHLASYQETLEKAKDYYDPSLIAKYAYQLAKEFNKFYGQEKIIVNEKIEMNTKLSLLKLVKKILDECISLLGMQVIDYM